MWISLTSLGNAFWRRLPHGVIRVGPDFQVDIPPFEEACNNGTLPRAIALDDSSGTSSTPSSALFSLRASSLATPSSSSPTPPSSLATPSLSSVLSSASSSVTPISLASSSASSSVTPSGLLSPFLRVDRLQHRDIDNSIGLNWACCIKMAQMPENGFNSWPVRLLSKAEIHFLTADPEYSALLQENKDKIPSRAIFLPPLARTKRQKSADAKTHNAPAPVGEYPIVFVQNGNLSSFPMNHIPKLSNPSYLNCKFEIKDTEGSYYDPAMKVALAMVHHVSGLVDLAPPGSVFTPPIEWFHKKSQWATLRLRVLNDDTVLKSLLPSTGPVESQEAIKQNWKWYS